MKKTQSNLFLETEPNPKSRTLSLTEHLQRNPTNQKGKGRPLPAQGAPLTDLTTVNLSRKKCPKTSGRTCVESMLCKVQPELYIPPFTQPTNNAPDLYHFTRLGVLCWFEVEQPWMVVCGLIWSGGLVWRWSDVGVDAWSDLWPDLRLVWLSIVVVWSGADLMDCRCGLVPWPNLEDWLRKMVCSDGWKLKTWEAEVSLVKRL